MRRLIILHCGILQPLIAEFGEFVAGCILEVDCFFAHGVFVIVIVNVVGIHFVATFAGTGEW